jgi:hypothetical protein
LAHILFTAACLDGTARRNKRLPNDWEGAALELRAAASILTVNGRPVESFLAVPHRDDGVFESVVSRHPHRPGGAQRFAVVMGEIRSKPRDVGEDIWLELAGTSTGIGMTADLWRDACGSCAFPGLKRHVLDRLGQPGQPVSLMVVGRAQLGDDGTVRLVSARLVVLGREYVPVESMLENTALIRLLLGRRKFIKPLLFLPGMVCRPDFILFDTERRCVIEVFGRLGNPRYDENAERKQVLYELNGIHLVAWCYRRRWREPPQRVSLERRWRHEERGRFGTGLALQRSNRQEQTGTRAQGNELHAAQAS